MVRNSIAKMTSGARIPGDAPYIGVMNRRRFIQSLAAVFSLPACMPLSLRPATAALPTAGTVPTQARFWAIYMSAVDGQCTPQTLQKMLHIPEIDAKRYLDELIANGVIKPNPLLKTSVSKVLQSSEDGVLNKLEKRLENKEQAEPTGPEIHEKGDETDYQEAEPEMSGRSPEVDLEVIIEDGPVEPELQNPDEINTHG